MENQKQYPMTQEGYDKLENELETLKTVKRPEVVEKIKEGKITKVGNNASLNVEKLLELNPNLVMTYGTGDKQTDNYPKIQEAGLMCSSLL